MAPLPTTDDPTSDDPTPGGADRYLSAWRDIARSMESGVSWSGHERNVAWLQGGGGGFVDASAVCGLDQVADGRVALACDWDGDGDQDVWLRSRSGATLRYLENQANPARHLVFEPGRPGASVTVELRRGEVRERVLLQTRSADGYLAGTRPRVTLALREGEEARGVLGEVEHLRLAAAATEPRAALDAGELREAPLPERVVLRSPLPLPASQLEAAGFRPGRPLLVIVDDPECERCRSQVPGFLDALREDGRVDVSRRSTGNPDDERAVLWAATTAAGLLGPGAQVDTPLSLLIDPAGRLQRVGIGALKWDALSQDLVPYALQPVQGAFRSTHGPPGAARWFHGMVRSNVALAEDLRDADLDVEADSYARSGRR